MCEPKQMRMRMTSGHHHRGSSFSMIYVVGIAIILLQLLAETSAYRALIPADPVNAGKCIYRGDELKAGVNNGIPPCQRLTCNEDGSILIEGCGKLSIDKCNHGERINRSKPYPECCLLRYKCKKPDGKPYFIERDAAEGA